jgi:hypothetical protein
MWIWILLILGILIAVSLGAAWAWNQYKLADADARRIEAERARLQDEQRAYADLASRLGAVTQLRTEMNQAISEQPTAFQNELKRAASEVWDRQEPNYPDLLFHNDSQTWGTYRDPGMVALDRERVVLNSVMERVRQEIASRRRAGGPTRPPCNQITGANCP